MSMAYETHTGTKEFETMLARAAEGHYPPSNSGLDSYVEAALHQIAKAAPKAHKALLSKARELFQGQLDGSNALLPFSGIEPSWPED